MLNYNFVYVCNFAANYAGNFIPCLAQLAECLIPDNIYYIFPKQAKHKNWLKFLPGSSDHIIFSEFELKSLFVCLKQLSTVLPAKKTIVHTHFIDNFQILAVRPHFQNIVCHYHMSVPKLDSWHRHLRRFINNIIYSNCIMVGVSTAVAKDLCHYYKLSKCVCITNAISFQSLNVYSQYSSVPTCINHEQFNLLIHGTHFWVKGVDIAIRAIKQLNSQNDIKCKLYITSHNPEECYKSIKQYTNNYEFIEVINVLDGIKNLYDKIDCFLSPSRSEAFGYAVVESAYCNCQVIASNVPGQDTMLDVPGILWIKPENIESLKNAIQVAIINKKNGSYQEINTLQQNYVQNNYDVSEWIEKNLSLYQEYFTNKKSKQLLKISLSNKE